MIDRYYHYPFVLVTAIIVKKGACAHVSMWNDDTIFLFANDCSGSKYLQQMHVLRMPVEHTDGQDLTTAQRI